MYAKTLIGHLNTCCLSAVYLLLLIVFSTHIFICCLSAVYLLSVIFVELARYLLLVAIYNIQQTYTNNNPRSSLPCAGRKQGNKEDLLQNCARARL